MAELEWSGERLEQIQSFTFEGAAKEPSFREELLYDCKGLGPVPRASNTGKPLGSLGDTPAP